MHCVGTGRDLSVHNFGENYGFISNQIGIIYLGENYDFISNQIGKLIWAKIMDLFQFWIIVQFFNPLIFQLSNYFKYIYFVSNITWDRSRPVRTKKYEKEKKK